MNFLAKAYILFRLLKKKPKYLVAFLGMFAGAILGIVLVVALLVNIIAYAKRPEANQYLKDNFVEVAPTPEKSTEEPPGIDTEADNPADALWPETVWRMEQDASDALWYGKINVEMSELKALSKDIIGWIYFEAADISYPLLYSGDNSTYLRALYTGEYRSDGSIFLEGANNPDLQDRHSIIYGHNMLSLTMFGQLKFYRDEADYYQNHQYFQLIYLDEETGETVKYRYHIFACQDVTVNDDVYYIYDNSFNGMKSFTDRTLRKNNYLGDTSDIKVEDDDYVVTLSTCSALNDRLVISAVRCGECRLQAMD